MKNFIITIAVTVMTFVSLAAMSCNGNTKDYSGNNLNSEGLVEADYNSSKISTASNGSNMQDSDAKQVVADYMSLKDALVADNTDNAAKAANKLQNSLHSFNISSYMPAQQKELKDIIADAKDHTEHIGKSKIDHQREHFKTLSKDIIDLIAITGTETRLYQQFCPMYEGGSSWLSLVKDVKNPYYGKKMLTCGKVQKEIK